MAREDDQMKLRLPTGMRERIKSVAEFNNRSMNAEIVATLEEAYGSDAFEIRRTILPTVSFKFEDIRSEINSLKKDVSQLRPRGIKYCPSVSALGKPRKAKRRRPGSSTAKMPRGRGG